MAVCFVFLISWNSSVLVGYFWICIPCPQGHLLQQYAAVWLPKNCWQHSGWYFLHAKGSSQIITCGKCWLMYTLWLYGRKNKPVSQMIDEHSIFIPVGKNLVFDQTEIKFKLNSKRHCQTYVCVLLWACLNLIVLFLCHQLATSKGLISGDLCYMEEDGTRIDCRSSSAVSSLNNHYVTPLSS